MTSTDTTQLPDGDTRGIVAELEARVETHYVNVVQTHPLFRIASLPTLSAQALACLVRNTLLESYTFTPRVVKSTFRAIGDLPYDMPATVKHACLHLIDEVDHGAMALRTFTQLGGDEQWARKRRMTPASFAMCATIDKLIDEEGGSSYLGYMYPFESITPRLAQQVTEWLAAKGIGADRREFVDTHAVDDIAHQRSLSRLLDEMVQHSPDLKDRILYVADVFFAVYPAPIWDAVLDRAADEMGEVRELRATSA